MTLQESKQTLTENTLQAIVRRFGKEVREFAQGGHFDQDLFEALYDYYFDDMPYGVKKGRDADPYEWIGDHFHDAIQSGDVEINETKVGHKDLDELAALAGIGGGQQMSDTIEQRVIERPKVDKEWVSKLNKLLNKLKLKL